MDNLVLLINSLSPTEKQHFKKRHNASSDFVLLFDYINKKKTCTTPEVLAYFSKKQSKRKSFNSSYLSVIKSYLKNRILESLRIQFIHKRKNYELLSRSMNTDILLEKGLYGLAKIEIEALNDRHLEGSFPIERLLLLRRKSLLDYFENYSNTNLEGIESLFETRIENAEQLLLEIKFARILSIMSFQYFNGLNDAELLNSFMNEPYMKDESLATDFATKYLFHWVHAQFDEFRHNTEGAMDHFNKSIEIWVQSPSYIEAHPRMYLGACFTYFKYLIHRKDPFSNLLGEINFDLLISKINTESLGTEEAQKYRFLFNLFEILYLREQRKFKDILKLVHPLLKDSDYIDEIPTFEKVIFLYYSSLANFDCGNFIKAENILFDLLNPLDKRLTSNPVYITVFILLHIMILLEVNNERNLKHLLPKYKLYLKQKGRLTQFESHFMKMAAQLISPRFKSAPDLVYSRFYDRLCLTQETDERGIKIEYDYIVAWVKKKEEQAF